MWAAQLIIKLMTPVWVSRENRINQVNFVQFDITRGSKHFRFPQSVKLWLQLLTDNFTLSLATMSCYILLRKQSCNIHCILIYNQKYDHRFETFSSSWDYVNNVGFLKKSIRIYFSLFYLQTFFKILNSEWVITVTSHKYSSAWFVFAKEKRILNVWNNTSTWISLNFVDNTSKCRVWFVCWYLRTK